MGAVEGEPVELEIVRGDITEQDVDAVVNAANNSLLGGGGVDGAIHSRGGPAILEACKRIRATVWPQGMPTGEAVATTAGDLPSIWVIHTVGPVWKAAEDRSHLLVGAYRRSLEVADHVGARTVAFPAISAGAYAWPMDDAARIAVRTVTAAAEWSDVELVRFVLFGEAALQAFERAAAD